MIYIAMVFSFIMAGEIGSTDPKKDQFIGDWTLDVEKTLLKNPIFSQEGYRNLLNDIDDHTKITFSIEGEFHEYISNETLHGKWLRYDKDLAVVRLGSDEKILAVRKRLKDMIDGNPDRYSRTRDHQRLYRLNRASVRKYHLSDGHIVQEVDLGDRVIRIFLKRAS
jgi:hypothetical protein